MRLRREGGFVLPEVLVVMVIGTILLGATLLTFERFVVHEGESDKRNDNLELARSAVDREAKQLRNLAKRVSSDVIAAPVTGDSFAFQTSDPTRTWVRYCLDSSDPTNGKVWLHLKSVPSTTTASPISGAMMTGCPSAAAGWSSTHIVADHIVNRIDGHNRPMFNFRCATGGSACINNSTTYDQIIGVDTTLYVDMTPNRGPVEQRVATGVYLRNQNQAPTAQFTATTVSGIGRTMLFNASGSTDYEQRTLTYYWFLNTMPAIANVRCDLPPAEDATTAWGGSLIGRGLTYQHTWAGTTPVAGTSQTVGLIACDPGDRNSRLVTRTVTIPT